MSTPEYAPGAPEFTSQDRDTPTLALDVVVTRGDMVEAHHRVHAAVVHSSGALLFAAGNPQLATWWRSCAKPFQLLPTLAHGHLERVAWSDEAIALACASHGGEPEHVAIASAMLASLGLDETALACGPHEPLASRGSRLLRQDGARPTRIHNNCSGKHAAMLAFAAGEGWALDGYHLASHPVQQAAHASVAQWANLPPDQLQQAVDGCGVTVFGLPLANMALAFARLGAAAHAGEAGPARVVTAMTRHPFLVGGTDRFDTQLMEACGGAVLCKIGAEGVHSLSIPARGIGIALKVEDGAARAQYPAVLALLEALGALPDTVPDALGAYRQTAIRNTRAESVGAVFVSEAPAGTVLHRDGASASSPTT